MFHAEKILLSSNGFCDVIDVTAQVSAIVKTSQIKNGVVVVFAVGSTAGVTTIETSAGLEEDLKDILDQITPEHHIYAHDKKWGDGNGFSHIRASLMGPSLSVPLVDGAIPLGTWQHIVVCDFDNEVRSREVVVQVVGE